MTEWPPCCASWCSKTSVTFEQERGSHRLAQGFTSAPRHKQAERTEQIYRSKVKTKAEIKKKILDV